MQLLNRKGLSLLKSFIFICAISTVAHFITTSCNNIKKEPKLVINEIMTSNHAGIMAQDGELYDWIEIKNISKETVNLKNYSLLVEKDKSNKKDDNNPGNENGQEDNQIKEKKAKKNKKDKAVKDDNSDKAEKKKTWEFPEMMVKPGQCVIVYASKLDKKDPKGELHASFKISSKGGIVQLLDNGDVVSEIKYGKLADDQCYRRVADNDTTFEISYEQTPGFNNDIKGFEKFNTLIEQQRKTPLKLWEVHSKGFKDGHTWVEVKNISNDTVNLKDYCLSNSKKDTTSWHFPDFVLKPGEVYVVDCKKEEFKIGGKKSVTLIKENKFIDGIWGAAAPFSVSIGRVDGKDGFFFFPEPTRGKENTTTAYRTIAANPTIITEAGVISDQKKMTVQIDTHGYTVHYTTDGSIPTEESPVYKDSISIDTTTIIRAYCLGDSASSIMHSGIATSTFIFGEKHDMPVMNITVDSLDLFDKRRGIYADGPGHGSEFPFKGANFWKKWWIKAHVEFFDSIQGFSEDCEMAIFGGFSRALAKKSFKIRFKDVTGPSEIFYDLYDEGKPSKVKNFVLRSGSQDITGVMVRDEYFSSLMAPQCPNLLVQAYRPIALYVNGEYFGLYYIREKIDKHFAAKHLNVNNDSISIIMSAMYCEEGNKKDYYDFISYVKSHDLAEQEHYDYVKKNFDFEGLIDFKLGQIYSCNTDVGNVRFIRSTDPKGDQKWHVVFYDLDATWVANKSASYYINPGGTSVERAVNLLTAKLLKNNEFRQLFLERLSFHMHKTFTTQNATSVFDKLINRIKPEMVRNCERWKNLMTYERWETNVEKFRERFEGRNVNMLNDLRKVMEITEEEEKKYFADLGY